MGVHVLVGLLTASLALCVSVVSEASVITFTDRTTFETAVGTSLDTTNFDALAGMTFNTPSGLTINGVNFVGLAPFAPEFGFFLGVFDNSTFPPLPATTSLETVNHLMLTFSAPVTAMGFDAYVTSGSLFGFNVPLVTSFSNGDTITTTLPPGQTFQGFQTTSPFLSLELMTGSSFLAIDNFSSPPPSPVPEPSTLVLLGIGTVVARFHSRRAGWRIKPSRLLRK